MNTSALGDEISSVPTVPCGEAHEDEVYFAFDMPSGDFPGDDVISAEADAKCTPEFSKFIGVDYEESVLDWYPFTPTAESWGDGDREVLCVAYDPEALTTGSFAGVGR